MADKSALWNYGYYVALKFENYLRKGGGQKDAYPGNLNNYVRTAVAARNKALKTTIPQSVKNDYASKLNEIYKDDTVVNSADSKYRAALQDEAASLAAHIEDIVLDQNSSAEKVFSTIQGGKSKTKQSKVKTYLPIETYINKLVNVIQGLKQIPASRKHSKQEIQKLIAQSESYYNVLVNLLRDMQTNDLPAWAKKDAISISRRRFGKGEEETYLYTKGNKDGVIAKLYALFDKCYFVQGYVSNASGKQAEKIALTTAVQLAKAAVGAAAEVVEDDRWLGDNSAASVIDITGFPAALKEDLFNDLQTLGKVTGVTDKSLNIKMGKEKIDVILPFVDAKGKIQNIGASVKAVNPFANENISLVGNTTLFNMLNGEDRWFTKAYYNIMAWHSTKEESKWRSTLSPLRKAAIGALKLLVFYKGISGDLLKRKAAQLFVYYNKATKKTMVLEINDIVTEILNSVQRGDSIDKYVSFSNSIGDLLDNAYAPATDGATGAQTRMLKLLKSARAQKLSAGFTGHSVSQLLPSLAKRAGQF